MSVKERSMRAVLKPDVCRGFVIFVIRLLLLTFHYFSCAKYNSRTIKHYLKHLKWQALSCPRQCNIKEDIK